MASLAKIYDTQKLLGQVYTPRFVVEKMLFDMGYVGNDLLGKTILDPSCGDGRFLVVVAEKIIEISPKEKLRENLEKIQGWDIDSKAVEYCLDNLNALVEDLGIRVNWQIFVENSLEKIHDNSQKFDFIVGNPPYIRIQHLPETQRKAIQQAYIFCKSGSTDIYIAFYQLCNHLLAENGVCALITPNSFFYSETAKELRSYFATQQSVIKITNYGDIQLFSNATTYSAIMIFGKTSKVSFVYEQAQNTEEFLSKEIDFSTIQHQKIWQLSVKEVENTNNAINLVKLKDICKIHVGVTTLCDKAYIFKICDASAIDKTTGIVEVETKLQGIIKLERQILKPIIKASKLKSSADEITEFILFPYQKVGGKHKIIAEEQLKTNFPLAYAYLLSVKEELDKRDNGKPNKVAWYAFGRSQGLDTSFGKKILFSPMNNKPNFIFSAHEDCTFYSGYCMKYGGDYDFLLNQLNSQRLSDYVQMSSRDFRGGWKAYNKTVIEEFTVFPVA